MTVEQLRNLKRGDRLILQREGPRPPLLGTVPGVGCQAVVVRWDDGVIARLRHDQGLLPDFQLSLA